MGLKYGYNPVALATLSSRHSIAFANTSAMCGTASAWGRPLATGSTSKRAERYRWGVEMSTVALPESPRGLRPALADPSCRRREHDSATCARSTRLDGEGSRV